MSRPVHRVCCLLASAGGSKGALNANGWVKFHGIATVTWIALVVPTVIWWKESLLWVALMSCYANVGTHWSAYQASRAEKEGP